MNRACKEIGHQIGPKSRCIWCDKRMGGDETALDDGLRTTYNANLLFWGTLTAACAIIFAPVVALLMS